VGDVRTIRPATEDEMVATFLQAEIDSPLWGGAIRPELTRFQLTEATVKRPDLSDPAQNCGRSAVLGKYRGWRQDKFLFVKWPDGVEWQFVALEKADLANVRYMNHPHWRTFSGNTLRPTVAADRVRRGDEANYEGIRLDAIKAIAAAMSNKVSFPPVIAMGTRESSTIVMVEGQTRITAYALVGGEGELSALLGIAPISGLRAWHWCQPEE
jgi:hypothetical protein